MITLFIDTSSSDVSIAILKGQKILQKIIKTTQNKHSEVAVELIEEILNKSSITPKEVNRIMVVTGPGSFTGLRIGVTIAKVYAYVENIEVIEISSLKQRAISTPHDICLSLIDAHHDNYYIGLYDKDNNSIIKEQFTNKEKVLNLINKYNPKIVSDRKDKVDNIPYQRQELDIEKIVSYYNNSLPTNPHLVNPNYLKLPEVLEKKWLKKK